MIYKLFFIFIAFAVFCFCLNFLLESAVAPKSQIETLIGQSDDEPFACSCCEFYEAPLDLTSEANISPVGEPGEPMVITGTVYQSDGKTPAADTIMYFYHTDFTGRYSKRGNEPRNSLAWWHGFHRGWLKTDSEGRYQLRTIKPAPYPDRSEPAHIHTNLKSPNQKGCRNIADFVFQDDSLLKPSFWENTDRWWRSLGISESSNYGGVKLTKNRDGIWIGQRDIKLFKESDFPSPDSGRRIGEQSPAFEPYHVWGPNKGSRACPMCVYGSMPGVLYWLNSDSDWENAAKIAQWLETESEKRGPRNFKAYFIYMNPSRQTPAEIEAKLTTFSQKLNLKNIAVTFIPSPEDKETAVLNEINPRLKNTIIVFRKRRVIDKFTEFTPMEINLNLLKSAIKTAENQTPPPIIRPVFQNSLEGVDEGFVLTKIKVNGQRVLAKLDTGSPKSIEVSSRFAERLFGSNYKTSKMPKLETLQIGDYVRKNQHFFVNSSLKSKITEQKELEVDVVLGWKFLSQHFFVIDYPNKQIRISESPIEMSGRQMYFNFREIENIPFVEGSLDKSKLNIKISTGTPFNQVLTASSQKNLKAVKEVNIEGFRLSDEWQFNQNNKCSSNFCEAVIGNNLLKKFSVYFDKYNRTIALY